MRPDRTTAAFLAAWLLWTAPATAQSLEEAERLMDEGAFVAAADAGAALGSAEGYIVAARSLAYHGRFEAAAAEREDILKRAMDHARQAVDMAPDDAEAYVELAHTSGRYAREIGTMAALRDGYAQRIRGALDEAVRRDPTNAAALVTLGSWHAEIVASAGRVMASLLYGADRDEALAFYELALATGQRSPGILREAARGLTLIDADRWGDRARDLLREALEMPAETAIDRIDRDRARDLLLELGG